MREDSFRRYAVLLWLQQYAKVPRRISYEWLSQKDVSWEVLWNDNPTHAQAISKADPQYAALFHKPKRVQALECLFRAVEQWSKEYTLIGLHESTYPGFFTHLSDPPLLLFARGNLALLEKYCIGVVGTRKPSVYGLQITKKVSAELSQKGCTIASGHAQGIDTAAHTSAIEAGGHTIAYLGGSHDAVEKRNARLYQMIHQNGLICSEYAPGSKTQAWMFPARNRLIAANASALLVPEAQIKSGTMITVKHTVDLGKEVFAVPGDIDRIQSECPNQLIKDGANVFTHIDDIPTPQSTRNGQGTLFALSTSSAHCAMIDRKSTPKPNVPEQYAYLIKILQTSPVALSADAIAEQSDCAISEIQIHLFELEMMAIIQRNSGGNYTLA